MRRMKKEVIAGVEVLRPAHAVDPFDCRLAVKQ